MSEDAWEKLCRLFTTYVGSEYVLGKSGFCFSPTDDGIDTLKNGLHQIEELVNTNIDTETTMKAIDVVDVNGGVAVGFSEKCLEEIVQDFCIENSLSYTEFYTFHINSINEEKKRLYNHIGKHISTKGLEYTETFNVLGQCGKQIISFLGQIKSQVTEIQYKNTYLDLWRLHSVIKKLNKGYISTKWEDIELTYEIIGISPNNKGIIVELFLQNMTTDEE